MNFIKENNIFPSFFISHLLSMLTDIADLGSWICHVIHGQQPCSTAIVDKIHPSTLSVTISITNTVIHLPLLYYLLSPSYSI